MQSSSNKFNSLSTDLWTVPYSYFDLCCGAPCTKHTHTQYLLRSNPEELSSCLLRSRNLQTCLLFYSMMMLTGT